jgi:hypothetical protein
MVEILKQINSALAFFLELIMLAAFCYWGFYGEKSVLLKWLLGIGTPLAVVVIWGLYLAPNAKHRLNITAGSILSSVLFLGSAIALYQTEHSVLAITLAIIVIIHQVLAVFWKQW